MPDCSENYEQEIFKGTNARFVKCKYCESVVLIPRSAIFTTTEFHLPLMKQSKSNNSSPETETVSLFWMVNDMYTFHNVGFSNSVGNTKFLICADCEAGPIGYHDSSNMKSYVALSRVQHS